MTKTRLPVLMGALTLALVSIAAPAARAKVVGPPDVAWKDMPQVVIHTPRDVDVDAGGAVWGSVGRSASVKLGNAGCGDWTVGNTDGAMRVSQAGSGDTRTGNGRTRTGRTAGHPAAGHA